MIQPASLQMLTNDEIDVDADNPRSTLIPPPPPWEIPDVPRARRSSRAVAKPVQAREPSWYPPAPAVPSHCYQDLADLSPAIDIEPATPTWIVPSFQKSA